MCIKFEQAFAKARAKLSTTAIPVLNDWLVARADADGFVPRRHGRRLVADASTLRFGHRASHFTRAANTDQIAFGLYLPGAEMMLAVSLHSVHEGERQMLFQHIDCQWTDSCKSRRVFLVWRGGLTG